MLYESRFREYITTLFDMSLAEDAVDYLEECRFTQEDIMMASMILATVAGNYAFHNGVVDTKNTYAFWDGLNKLIQAYCWFDTKLVYK